MRLVVIVLMLFICSSCCSHNLYVSHEAVSKDSLASVHVNTPDPLHEVNPVGQRLFVSWKLPRSLVKSGDVQGVLKVRYFNNQQENIPFQVNSPWGRYMYSLLDDEYFEKNGLMTYKVEIIKDGKVLKEWKHQLWAELISFDI